MLAPEKNQGFELSIYNSNIVSFYSENFTKLLLSDNSNPGALCKLMQT